MMTALRQQEPCYASVNLRPQWRTCYRKVLGLPEEEESHAAKQQRRTTSSKIRVTNLLPSSEEQQHDSSLPTAAKHHDDVWMESALEIQSNINAMASWIVQKKLAYVSLEMPSDEASLIQSTVTSFVATTATEMESLRNLINQQQQQESQRSHHQTGIVEILLGRLKEEIADPFGRLQKQRSRRAVQLWQKPIQCSLMMQPSKVRKGSDELDAVLGLEEEPLQQQFLPTRPAHRLHRDFLASYQLLLDDDEAKRVVTPRRPKSALFKKRSYDDKEKSNNLSPDSKPSEPKRLKSNDASKLPYQAQATQPLNDDTTYYTAPEQLQQEAMLLTASLQSDLDSVQKMESMMVDITALLSQFSELVVEQQDKFIDIHDSTATAKQNVAQGQEELVDAKERTQQSHHYMAKAIASMGVLLLFFHWVRP